MGYKFNDKCYETLFDMHAAFASFCQASGSGLGTNLLSCKPDSAGYVVIQSFSVSNGTPGTPWNFYPPQVTCDYSGLPTTADIVETAWLVVGVWVVAWAFRKMADTFWKR